MAVLVVDPETAEAAAALTRDSGTPGRRAHPRRNLRDRGDLPGPDDPAYVIYTSGSTGVPKGPGRARRPGRAEQPDPAGLDVTAADVWLAASSFSFDASVWEMWGALTTGARLVIADRVDLVDRERLARLVRREAVTVLFQTPGALYRLLPPYLRALDAGETSRIRYVVLGGEALSWSRLASLIADAPGLPTVFVNMYGITEGTIHVTIFRASAADVPRVREVPSACRCRRRAATSSTRTCGRPASTCPASCTAAARSWRAATWTTRS
ncbi:AMP-binding protein [Micromonospora sp. M12]